MSRIGNMPVTIPSGVTITINDSTVSVKGPKGELAVTVPDGIYVTQENSQVNVVNKRKDKPSKALFGLTRALIANQVAGVTEGYSKTLELVGVGYRANLSGTSLNLSVGFSHPVVIKPPQGISFVVNEGKIVVSGNDKQLVGQIAADIRAVKPPEPYKGKGIRYSGEHVRKKAGKSAKAVGGK